MAASWCGAPTSNAQQNILSKSITFPQSVSAYFERPSKVTKPSSRNHSPRNNGRRRMTTQVPLRMRSMVDTPRAGMIPRQQIFNSAVIARPKSWHPSFTNDFEQIQAAYQQFIHQPYEYPLNTTFVHGLVTPTSYPTINEPYIDCQSTPHDRLTGQDYAFFQNDFQPSIMYQYTFDNTSTPYTPMSAGSIDATEHGNLPWPSVPLPNMFDVATVPASLDFLPMPDMGQAFGVSQVEDDVDINELVGMGLYDSPAQVQSANLLFGGSIPIRRKSLKLEESFEPPPPEEGEDEDVVSDWSQLDNDSIPQETLEQPSAVQDTQSASPTLQSPSNNDVTCNGTQAHVIQNYAVPYEGQQLVTNGMMYGWF